MRAQRRAYTPEQSAFAFALACVERQWPIYERGSIGQVWWDRGGLEVRNGIDAGWRNVIEGVPLPIEIIARAASGMPTLDEIDRHPIEILEISNTVVDVLTSLRDHEISYAHRPAYRNLSMLESLADEIQETHDLGSCVPSAWESISAKIGALLNDEVQRQDEDLKLLKQTPSTSSHEPLRSNSTGRSLFGELWFSQLVD